MTEIDISQLGWLLGLIGIAFGIWGQARNGKKDSDTSAREMATILTKLEYVSEQVKALGLQVTGFNGCLIELAARLGAVEKSAERAHVRVDKLEAEEP